MIYNITSTEDYASSQVLQLIKNGNKYRVELYNRETIELGKCTIFKLVWVRQLGKL